jgi:hypothetical protein
LSKLLGVVGASSAAEAEMAKKAAATKPASRAMMQILCLASL